jgi:CheY-like chemotaxis protein
MDDATNGTRGMDDGPRCRVLVVDDNVDSAQSMSLLLGLEGYVVECAYDGEEALARAAQFGPDVVLLDLGLPRFSGYEVARRLRGEAGGVPLPDDVLLVAVSGYGRERDRQAAREAGFDLHLTKPADPDEVLRVLVERRRLREIGRAARSTTTARPDAGAAQAAALPAAGADSSASSPAAARVPQSGAPVAGAAPNA